MAIRITQSTMYSSMLSGMQNTLGSYMESLEQGSSQKKVNRPSDNPASMTRILNTRHTIALTEQQETNVDTATGWLSLADKTLTQVSTTVSSIKALAEQAATGTYTSTNREQISYEIKQLFEQLVNLSNTRYENNTMFAGHKYSDSAFTSGLNVTTWDNNLAGTSFTVNGSTDHSIALQFTGGGTVGTDAMTYRWSKDGGSTWQTGTLAADADTLDMDGVSLTIPKGSIITAAANTDKADAADGSFLYIRPAAVYQGDDNDVPNRTSVIGGPVNLTADAQGNFTSNVLLRFDNDVDMTQAGQKLSYAYSKDNGSTWTQAEVTTATPASGSLRLPITDGYVDVTLDTTDPANPTQITAGTQVLVHPDRANLYYTIADDSTVTVNNVGKDVFGGIYTNENGNTAAALTEDTNLMEIVGDLIAYTENNNQQGCQQCLDKLSSAQNHILTEAARVGGMENRLSQATDILSFQKLDQKDRLSYIQDVDLTELLTKLTQQQTAYQTVLQSSSMIMQMNLTNYL